MVVRAADARFSRYGTSSNLHLDNFTGFHFGTGSDYKAADLLRGAGIQPHTSDDPLGDLRNGQVDLLLIDAPIVAYYVQGKGMLSKPDTSLRAIGQPLFADTASAYVMGLSSANSNAHILLSEINAALVELKMNGVLKSIYQGWGLMNDLQASIGIR